MTSGPVDPSDRVPRVAASVLAGHLDRDPVEATYLGDHDRDALLPDPGVDAARARAAEIRARLAELDAVEPHGPDAAAGSDTQNATRAPSPPVDDTVDIEVMRTVLAAELLELDDVGEDVWNPMRHNPGPGVHALLSRDFAPPAHRLAAVTARLAATPDFLAAARERLGAMSAIHVDTAIDQLAGTLALVDEAVAVADTHGVRTPELDSAADAARSAVDAHRDWLRERRAESSHDPRLGVDLFRAKLAVALDTALDPESLLTSAEAHLDRTRAEIEELAGRIAGVADPGPQTVRDVLDRLAADVPDDETILPRCRDALALTTELVRGHDVVTVYDDPVSIVRMPEIDRGVAVAYCRPAGPLETTPLPTEFAVSPTPADWDEQRVRSFYREYNDHMLRNLTVHEAMPGHALQLMHANRHRLRARTPVRAVWWNGSFVEGWAVYTEEVMAAIGNGTDAASADAVRMQQLKMQLRTTLNAILDIRFHCDGLSEDEALDLMQRRGFQEAGEAVGKWRRVQLSSTQLCMYYVGYVEVRGIHDDLAAAHPDWTMRQRHDAMLAHGSPPSRHLRTLLGLGPGG